MQTLMINDLSVTEVLDRKAMSAVRGGMSKYLLPYYSTEVDKSKHHFVLDASQAIAQEQNFGTATGNNVAFLDFSKITADVDGKQRADNTIRF